MGLASVASVQAQSKVKIVNLIIFNISYNILIIFFSLQFHLALVNHYLLLFLYLLLLLNV